MSYLFTVSIQASNADGSVWHALHPAENVDTRTWGLLEASADDVAEEVARQQEAAVGDNWRVCVWVGADADTSTEPAYIWEPTGLLDLLNNYSGSNIWQDLILTDALYDEQYSDAVDVGANDRFVAGGRLFRHDAQAGAWYDAGPYPESEGAHYTAWLTTDPSYLEDGLTDVAVVKDELTGDGQWTSTGNPLVYLKTTVDVSDYDVHSRSQDEAETLLINAGWRAADGWLWRPVATGYLVTVERAR
jgi:hypothetical protein